MKVAIVGSRGIPASYGGFETFAEEISYRLNARGMDVTVVCQHTELQTGLLNCVNLVYSRYSKAHNPLLFYRDSLRKALKGTDIILVCGVGGAIFYPLLNRKGCLIITHVDGREELRGKYSFLKKMYVRIAQLFAAKYSDHIIADSFAIRKFWLENYNLAERKISAIEFGANFMKHVDDSCIDKLGLQQAGYYLVVCRMVPENNLENILKGFVKSGSMKKLVLVGDVSDEFGRALKKFESSQIIFPGSIYNKQALFALRKNCFAYIHGHSVGGTNPSLLEAMAAGSICICHDNEYNRETTNGSCFYFKDENELAEQILKTEALSELEKSSYSLGAMRRILNYYNWDRVTDEYVKLFQHK